jgi:hypothetical protein
MQWNCDLSVSIFGLHRHFKWQMAFSLQISLWLYMLMHTFFEPCVSYVCISLQNNFINYKSCYSCFFYWFSNCSIPCWFNVIMSHFCSTSNCLMALRFMKSCHLLLSMYYMNLALHILWDLLLEKSEAPHEPKNGQYTNDICAKVILTKCSSLLKYINIRLVLFPSYEIH